MPDLNFAVESAEPAPYSVTPMLYFKLRITCDQPVEGINLQCQIRIDAVRRRYTAAEQRHLRDLFGEPERWSQTLHSMLWTHTTASVRAFSGSTVVDLPVPCTFDMTVAAAKYFHGLQSGEAPLSLLFSGTVFYESAEGALEIAQIPWDRQASYSLPASTWKGLMETIYPNTGWLCVRRDLFDRLHQYKIDRGIPTWEQALESLLP